ncbi:MAG: hypothetical protein H7X77_02415 [Anaerolineae bacterium]|nr:hypothetical protein [Anaerolineae bacterium]
MSINSRLLATLMIGVLWVMTSIAVVSMVGLFGFYSIFLTLMMGGGAFAVASAVTYAILASYDSGKAQAGDNRRERVNKLLRQLDDRDLDELRERLMYDDGGDGEYESLEALLQQKQKR